MCLKDAGQSLRNNSTVLDLWSQSWELGITKKKKIYKQLQISTGSSSGGGGGGKAPQRHSVVKTSHITHTRFSHFYLKYTTQQ